MIQPGMNSGSGMRPALERMKLTVEISKEAAILAAKEQWGKVEIEADLAALKPEERAWIAAHNWAVSIEGAEPTLEAWQAAVDKMLAGERAEKEKQQRESHDRLAKLMASSTEQKEIRLGVSPDGSVAETPYDHNPLLTTTYEYQPSHLADWAQQWLSPDDKAAYESWYTAKQTENEARRKAAIEAAAPAVIAAAKAKTEADAKAKAEAEARESARWSIMTGDTRRYVVDWEIESGCVSIPETGRCGSWLATVAADKSERSGYRRSFWDRGAAGYARVPGHLQPGDYVENGTKDKKGRNDYTYYRVLAVLPDRITVRQAGRPGVNPKSVQLEIEQAAAHPACTWTKPQDVPETNGLAQYSTEQLQAELDRRTVTTLTA